MVLRSQARSDRSSAAIPEVESGPETEVALDVENPVEVEINVPIIDEGDFGITSPGTAEKLVSQLIFISSNECSSERMV